MKRAIIIGATGIIGVALTNSLLRKGIEVVAVIRSNSKRECHLPTSDMLKIVYSDIDRLDDLDPENIGDSDVLYYLTWDGAADARNDVARQLKNIEYMLSAISLSKKTNAKFVGVGSQAEYGVYDKKRFTDDECKPNSAYGIAKLAAMNMGKLYAEQNEVPFVWTRVFSVYGPYDIEKTLIMSCIRTLVENGEMFLTKCEQQWDYIYADDAASILFLVGEKGKNGEIYNLCSGQQKSLFEYVKIVENVYKAKHDSSGKLLIGKREYVKGQSMCLAGDISNLCKDTGFEPQVSFEHGIEKTIEWYMERGNAL